MLRRTCRNLFLLLVMSLGGLGCQAESLPDLIERAKPSVLMVGTYSATDSPRFGFRGSGFIVGNGRQAVTNAHVLPGPEQFSTERKLVIQVRDAAGKWVMRQVSRTRVNAAMDLALLTFEGEPGPPLQLAELAAREGESIAIMGFPIAGALGFSTVTHAGIISALTPVFQPMPGPGALTGRAIRQAREEKFNLYQLDAVAYPGNSGGPVFSTTSGQVIGVINMVLARGSKESALSNPTGISYAIPSAHVVELMRTSD
ncbi:S1C family serine protease [Paucibacter sp. JuS9]|uniref:S1C family serine protease n=1 Tax=Paucibacter sp. JuS9 TaxID=3228748 RepID=UPI003756AD6F